MGFFKNMISGGAGIAGANNAHLAEMLLKGFSPQDKFRVLERMIKMYKRAGGIAAAPELIIRRFNEANSRVAQLNIIALALADLGYPSPIPGESWMAVQNPFSLGTDETDLEVNAGHMRRKHQIHIALPKSKIDFNLWIVEALGE